MEKQESSLFSHRSSYRIILLTGPKHSGKSLCARTLGKLTGAGTADLDDIIEKETGKTPRALYKEGPEIFRKAEALALASLVGSSEAAEPGTGDRWHTNVRIIAAGGGLADNAEALALLSRYREIITVYLDVAPETAWQRILDTAAGGELPPFLNTENPRETHFALHTRRAKVYKAIACFTVSADNKSPGEIAGEIARRFQLPVNIV